MLLNNTHGQALPAGLTCMPDKAALYSVDPYFRDGWEDLVESAGPAAVEQARGHALVLLRPDVIALRKAHIVIDWLPAHGFRLVACYPMRLDRHQVRALWHYQCNVGTRERRDTYDALLGASTSLLLVVANDETPAREMATQRFSDLKGNSDPAQCKPGDLRAALGHKTYMLSLVHSPDEAADFVRETAAFLPERERKQLFAKMKARVAMPAAEAQGHVSALYRSAPEHSLDFNAALTRITNAVVAAASPGGAANAMRAETRALLALTERIAAGHRSEWRELFAVLDHCRIPYQTWDKIVIASHLAAKDADDKRVLLDHPPREALAELDLALEG